MTMSINNLKNSLFDIINKISYLQESVIDNEYDLHSMYQLKSEFKNICQEFFNKHKNDFINLCNTSEFQTKVYEHNLHNIVDITIYGKSGDYCSVSFPDNNGYLEDVYINSTGICNVNDMNAQLYRKGFNYIVTWRGIFTVEIENV